MAQISNDTLLKHHHITEIGEDLGALARVNPDALEAQLPFEQVAQFETTTTCKAMQRMAQDHGAAFYHAVFLAILDKESLAQDFQEQCLKAESDFNRGIKRGLEMALEWSKETEDTDTWSSLVHQRIHTHFETAANMD